MQQINSSDLPKLLTMSDGEFREQVTNAAQRLDELCLLGDMRDLLAAKAAAAEAVEATTHDNPGHIAKRQARARR